MAPRTADRNDNFFQGKHLKISAFKKTSVYTLQSKYSFDSYWISEGRGFDLFSAKISYLETERSDEFLRGGESIIWTWTVTSSDRLCSGRMQYEVCVSRSL